MLKFVRLGAEVAVPDRNCVVIEKVGGAFFVTAYLYRDDHVLTDLCEAPVEAFDVAFRKAVAWAERHGVDEIHTRFFDAASEAAARVDDWISFQHITSAMS